MLGAFGNIYSDLADTIRSRAEGHKPDAASKWYPTGEDGLHTLSVVHAAVRSAQSNGAWTEV